jgi:predicted transcriptional regulator
MTTMPSNILLLSIRPEYANKIFEGTKNVELRRVRTRLNSGDLVIVYVSSPEKALVGSFEVERVITVENLPKELNSLWKQVKEHAGLKRKQFNSYYKGASVGVGIFFRNIQIFPQRIELEYLREQLPNIRPPQSYRYLTSIEVSCVESILQCSILDTTKKITKEEFEQLALPISI